MHEVLHWAAGSRLPIVLANVNRAMAAPWTVWCDHTDSLAQRDTGWIQFYCENCQEAFDTVLQAYRISEKYRIPVREAELVAAPIESPEGARYISAVMAGINCAFANRQAIGGLVRGAFKKVFSLRDGEIRTMYEVGHNNLKFEEHEVDGARKRLLVHRKGATRAFGAGRSEVPERYRGVGQPVLVGGTMGTASYVLVGTEKGMSETFGSAVHGAGRRKSRKQALREYRGGDIIDELDGRGILVKVHSRKGAAEEAPGAYKDVDSVVAIMEGAGVNSRVARLKPMVCIKG